MSDGEFQIEKEPVHGRDTSAIKMFAGLSMGEIMILLLSSIFLQLIVGSGLLTMSVAFVLYIYFRSLRSKIPDGFFANAYQFYTRDHQIYRAGGRDYEWRPPVVPD